MTDSESEGSELTESSGSWPKYLRVDNALLVAGVPLLAYVLITAHIIGKGRHFGIPYELLSVRFTDNLFAIISISSFVLFLGLAFGMAVQNFAALSRSRLVRSLELESLDPSPAGTLLFVLTHKPYFSGALVVAMAALFASLPILMSSRDVQSTELPLPITPESVPAFIAILTLLLLTVSFLYITFRLGKWSLEGNQVQRNRVLNLIAVFAVFGSLVLSSYISGRGLAQNQTDYYVLDGNPEMVVLYMTSDRLIVTTFDRAKGIAGSGLSVFLVEDLDGRLLTLERVGPLESSSRGIASGQLPLPISTPILAPISNPGTPPPNLGQSP